MKNIFKSGFLAGAILLIVSILALLILEHLFPKIADEFYSPTYRELSERRLMFFLHPFILAITLSWFWQNFKTNIKGTVLFRGIWLGLIYGAVALLPAIWLTYSSMNVSFQLVVSWYVYGLIQACIAGLVFSKTNP